MSFGPSLVKPTEMFMSILIRIVCWSTLIGATVWVGFLLRNPEGYELPAHVVTVFSLGAVMCGLFFGAVLWAIAMEKRRKTEIARQHARLNKDDPLE
jgi:hypothetical protein